VAAEILRETGEEVMTTRKGIRGKRLRDTEAQKVVPIVGVVTAAVGRAEEPRSEVPRTAASHMGAYVATLTSNGTVRRRSVVAVMIGVLDPLPDVAVACHKGRRRWASSWPGCVLLEFLPKRVSVDHRTVARPTTTLTTIWRSFRALAPAINPPPDRQARRLASA
jgi:hypothetical protein